MKVSRLLLETDLPKNTGLLYGTLQLLYVPLIPTVSLFCELSLRWAPLSTYFSSS